MNDEIVCPACNDTGMSSNGGPCHPCLVKGRQPLKNAVLRAVSDVFDLYHQKNAIPDLQRVQEAVSWAFGPRDSYVMGYPNEGGGVIVLEGPRKTPERLFDLRIHGEAKRYIIRITKKTFYSEPVYEPIARWQDGEWQMKSRRS